MNHYLSFYQNIFLFLLIDYEGLDYESLGENDFYHSFDSKQDFLNILESFSYLSSISIKPFIYALDYKKINILELIKNIMGENLHG